MRLHLHLDPVTKLIVGRDVIWIQICEALKQDFFQILPKDVVEHDKNFLCHTTDVLHLRELSALLCVDYLGDELSHWHNKLE